MILPARTIWDTGIQCVCGVVTVREAAETEIWFCANFGQVSLDPQKVIINPNRLYPVERMIRRVRRFSLHPLPADQLQAVLRLMRLRRRQPRKPELVGWHFEEGDDGSQFLREAMQSLFCEVENILDTGDHTVIIGRVEAVRENPDRRGRPPLLYSTVRGAQSRAMRGLQAALRVSGALLAARKILNRLRPPGPANLPEATYRDGGQTDAEIDQVLSYGVLDRGRILTLPPAFRAPRQPVVVCVVGTHWGTSHCEALRKASPAVRLFVCGRDEQRTARMARALKAEGYFVGFEAAVRDSRIQAMTLAIPHHLHREAAEAALVAGKHVLVEKPIATNLADANAMIEAARRHGRILMAAENMYYRPTVRAVTERVIAGELGEPLHMIVQTGGPRIPEGWVADREKLGGGVFMDIGIHYVRAMRLLLGEPDEVAAFRTMQVQTKMSGEDGLSAVFSSRYGWRCQMFTTWAGRLGKVPDIILVGDRGTFHLWPLTGYFDWYPVAPGPITQLIGYVRPYWLQAKLMSLRWQRVRTRIGGEDTGYREEMAAFLNAISVGDAMTSSAEEGRRDLEIVLCAYGAMQSGRVAEIPGVGGVATPQTAG